MSYLPLELLLEHFSAFHAADGCAIHFSHALRTGRPIPAVGGVSKLFPKPRKPLTSTSWLETATD